MKVKIKRIDKTLPLPLYESNGAAGIDFTSRLDMTIKPKEIALIPSNVIIETPEGYMLQVSPRSSTPRKKGLTMPHSVGVIDSDYSGNEDEILIQVYNFSDKDVEIVRGEKIAQGVFVKIDRSEWVEVDEMNSTSRGGFGSTDIK